MNLRFNPAKQGFRGLPVSAGVPAKADAVVFGAPHGTPYAGVDNRPFEGAPEAIRAGVSHFSQWLDHYDFDLGGPLIETGTPPACDAGDLATVANGEGEANRAMIRNATAAILDRSAVPIMIGGDDSVPIPFIEGFAGRGPICIVQVDAHIDWRKERLGERFGFSSTMRRASEMAHVARMVQVGMRGYGSARAWEVADARAFGSVLVTAHEVHREGIGAALRHVPDGMACIITVDCDGVDPTTMPAVMAPAPGGLGYTQIMDLIAGVAAKGPIAGFDIVEFVPGRDLGGLGALTAGRLATVALGHILKQKRAP